MKKEKRKRTNHKIFISYVKDMLINIIAYTLIIASPHIFVVFFPKIFPVIRNDALPRGKKKERKRRGTLYRKC